MTATSDLALRRMSRADVPAVLQLLTTTMAGGPTGTRSEDFFHWKHTRNHFGASPGLLAFDGDLLVGLRLFMRWQLRFGDRPLSAVRAVDTATHPDYQRRGIFSRLTLSLLEELDRTEDLHLVFNTPNADSLPGYRRMGWQDVGLVPIRISPVRPLRFVRGLAAARRATASGPADAVAPVATSRPVSCELPGAGEVLVGVDGLEDLLASGRRPTGLHTARSTSYLQWRYGDAPGLDYRVVEVRHHGRLTGLGIGRLRHRAGLTELTLGEVLVAEGDMSSARQVLRGARRAGADHVAVHCTPGSEIARVALQAGYVTVPGQGIQLVANPRPGCPPDVLDARQWELSLGDLEVF